VAPSISLFNIYRLFPPKTVALPLEEQLQELLDDGIFCFRKTDKKFRRDW
jgi:hypothetical protein